MTTGMSDVRGSALRTRHIVQVVPAVADKSMAIMSGCSAHAVSYPISGPTVRMVADERDNRRVSLSKSRVDGPISRTVTSIRAASARPRSQKADFVLNLLTQRQLHKNYS